MLTSRCNRFTPISSADTHLWHLPLAILLLSAVSGVVAGDAKTYGTQTYSAAPPQTYSERGTTVRSAPAACKTCGWVESCSWVESPDPVLVGAAASGRFTAQGQMAQTGNGAPAPSGAGGWGVPPGPSTPAHYDIRIRMSDGSLRLVQQPDPLPLGAEVRMVGTQVRLVHD
jgi:hypothetical protein